MFIGLGVELWHCATALKFLKIITLRPRFSTYVILPSMNIFSSFFPSFYQLGHVNIDDIDYISLCLKFVFFSPLLYGGLCVNANSSALIFLIHRECPEECREAVSSLMQAAARFADLPELRELRTVFSERYENSLDVYVNKEVLVLPCMNVVELDIYIPFFSLETKHLISYI